eukprot:6141555-Alexandrium_andersonii.AAC.1
MPSLRPTPAPAPRRSVLWIRATARRCPGSAAGSIRARYRSTPAPARRRAFGDTLTAPDASAGAAPLRVA